MLKALFYRAIALLPQRWIPRSYKLRLLIRSGALDYAWYRHATQQMPETALELAEGVWEDDRERVGNPLFSADYYRLKYGFTGTPGEALLDFVLQGERKGRRPVEWFDPAFFRQHNPEAPKGVSSIGLHAARWPEFPKAHPYFDQDWYVSAYPDVAASGRAPLAHFVNDGIHEGREPNELFDSRWYLAQNPDIAGSGMSAATHFCNYGSEELRNPGPAFDMRRYAGKYPEYRATGLDPLGHYLTFGRNAGIDVTRMLMSPEDLLPSQPPQAWRKAARDMRVDVIIPVYRNLQETRECIESVLASDLGPNVRIRVRNDASPEPEVTEWLRDEARQGRFSLHENERNLGFVGTVNHAMRESLEHGCDAVLLLNSDTEVAGDWVTRLMAHACAEPAVSSVTPLSNNATICSWPKIGSNPLPDGARVADLDALAWQSNAGESVEIPTGVGFCMLITAHSLEKVGLFDEAAFGKGYGEENDFCMRAMAAGFTHLLATDVFVHHQGEVSFAQDSAPGKRNAEKVILSRYPDYNQLVSQHIGQDPALMHRLRLLGAHWRQQSASVTAFITHHLGGGTERQVMTRALQSAPCIIIRPVAGFKDRIQIENPAPFDGFELVMRLGSSQEFASILKAFAIDRIEVHHGLSHGSVVRGGIALAGLPFEFHVHDYFSICPQITLTDENHEYCGEPGPEGCDACIAQRPSHSATDITNWRTRHSWMIQRASRVVAPSLDAARRIGRYAGRDVDVVPHEQGLSALVGGRRSERGVVTQVDPLRIVVLGVLAPHKGKATVLSLLREIDRRNLDMHVHLVGYCGLVDGELSEGMASRFSSTGWYRESELDDLVSKARPDMFLFASTAPETYSFTLTTAMRTGLPILAPRHGAYPERLADYRGGELFDPSCTAAELTALVQRMVSKDAQSHAA